MENKRSKKLSGSQFRKRRKKEKSMHYAVMSVSLSIMHAMKEIAIA